MLDIIRLKRWSIRVRTRDSFTCRSCGSRKDPQAHHIVSKYRNNEGAYTIKNGITLCKECHICTHGIHGKGMPKNELIVRLRSLHRLNDINLVLSLKEFKIIKKDRLKHAGRRFKIRKFYRMSS